MEIEYEATFENVDKGQMRDWLKKSGAKFVWQEFLQKRNVYFFSVENNLVDGS